MNRSRLGGAAFDALVIAFTLGAVLSPPDPLTQLLYAGPTFAVVLLLLARYGPQSFEPWWKQYLVFVGGVLAVALAWRVLAFAVGSPAAAGVRPAFLLAGVALGAWLAFFGGLMRVRGEVSEA